MTDKRFKAMKARHEVRKLKFENDTDTGREMLPVDIQDITELIAEVDRLQASRNYLAMFVRGRGHTETPPAPTIAMIWDWLQESKA